MTDMTIEPEVLLSILQQDHPKEYMLALQKATIMKQQDLIAQLQSAVAASNGAHDPTP